MDFTYNSSRLGNTATESIYGGGQVAKGIADGVSLLENNAEKSAYALNNGYSSPTALLAIVTTLVASGSVTDGGVPVVDGVLLLMISHDFFVLMLTLQAVLHLLALQFLFQHSLLLLHNGMMMTS